MDPVSIGTAVAVVAAKTVGKKLAEAAAEKVGEEAGEAGWGLGRRMVAKVHSWFSTDEDAVAALEAVVDNDNPAEAEVVALAELIDERLEAAPLVKSELQPMVDQAHRDEVLSEILKTAPQAQIAGGDIHNQRAGNNSIVAGGDVNINQR